MLAPVRRRRQTGESPSTAEAGRRPGRWQLTSAHPSTASPTPSTTSAPPATVTLTDGTPLRLRALTEDDSAGLRRFYEALSPATLHRRFMTPTPRLPDGALARLTETGRPDREVVVAIFRGEIVAEGRFHHLTGSDEAEIALVVADAWQGRGIGPALSAWLARSASSRGITGFAGSMLTDNRAARRVLETVAPQSDRRISSGELQFRAPLFGPLGQAVGPSATGSPSSRFRRNRRVIRASRPCPSTFGSSGGGSSLVS